MDTIPTKQTQAFGHLVDIHGLLEALFGDKANHPSKRWIQYQMARKTIPYFRISGLTRFDPVMVRQALEENCLITAGTAGRRRHISRRANAFKHTSEALKGGSVPTSVAGLT